MPLAQVSTHRVAAEVARATAVLIALAVPTSVAAAIEAAVIAEPIVGAVDGLPGGARLAAARRDGVMETLIRVITGAAEGGLRMMPRCSRSANHREHGRNRRDHSSEHSTSRASSGQRPGQVIKSPVIHRTRLQSRRGRSM